MVCFACLVTSVFSLDALVVCAVMRANLTSAGSTWSRLVALAVIMMACFWKSMSVFAFVGSHPFMLDSCLYLSLVVMMLVGIVILAVISWWSDSLRRSLVSGLFLTCGGSVNA